MKVLQASTGRILVSVAAVGLLAVAVGAGDRPASSGVFSGLKVGDKVQLREPRPQQHGFIISTMGDADNVVAAIGHDHIALESKSVSADNRAILRYIPASNLSQVIIATPSP